MNEQDSTSAAMSHRGTGVLAVVVAIASWLAMASVLGYGGMQRVLSPTMERLPELLLGALGGGLVAFATSGVFAAVTRTRPRIGPLLGALLILDVAAALGALALFNEIPIELFPIVVLAAMGGGSQLLGAGLAAGLLARA